LLLAFERIDTCREPARFAGWLFQIVRNQSRNFLQKRRLRDVLADDDVVEPGGDGNNEEQLMRSRLIAALSVLRVEQREVVLLHDLQGWTHPEISAALGISEVMSRQHLFQARRELRAKLDDGELGGEP
jgi:RNA polymerase sigma-70 factor (ECF subfamily)